MVLVLIGIGVTASIGRVVFPADLIQRTESARTAFLKAFDRQDPLALQRPAELARMNRPFAEHRFLTLLHVVPGSLFFVFAPLQFSARRGGASSGVDDSDVCERPGDCDGSVVGGPIEFVLTPYGVPPSERFVLAIWAAWLLTLGGAEWWIRNTRPRVALAERFIS